MDPGGSCRDPRFEGSDLAFRRSNLVSTGAGHREGDRRANEDNGDTGADRRPVHDTVALRPPQGHCSHQLDHPMQNEASL